MAVTRVSSTRDGLAAIRYALEEASHKEGMDRVLALSGHNIDPDFTAEQMSATWKAHYKDGGDYVQMYRLIQSFSTDEFDPQNPDDAVQANQVGYETAAELFPNHQVTIVTQADGEGGKLHNHILVNAVAFESGKSVRGNEASWETVAEKSDEILRRHDIEPLEFKAVSDDRKTMGEVKGKYVWKDDMKERIAAAASDINVTTREQFIEHLEQQGVKATYRGKKDPKLSYSFTDPDSKLRQSRAKMLGGFYEAPAIDERLADNAKRLEGEQTRKDAAIAEQARKDAAAEVFIDKELERQSEANNPVHTDDFEFDLDAELSKLTATRQPVRRTRKEKVIEPVFEEKVIDPIDTAHIEAKQLNRDFDDRVKAEEAAAAAALKAKQEKERAEAEAKEKAERERKAAELAAQEAEREKVAKQQAAQRKWFEYFDKRYDKATLGTDKDKTDEHVRRFGRRLQEIKATGAKRNGPGGRKYEYTDHDVIFEVRSQMFEEQKAQRQDAQPELHQQHDFGR